MNVDGAGQVLQRVMKISGIFCIVTNKKMVELAERRMQKSSGAYKLRGATSKSFRIDALGLGKRKLARQLKKAGFIFPFL